MSDLLKRKETGFVLWRPGVQDPTPRLVIGQLLPGNPPSLIGERRLDMRRTEKNPDLWTIPAAECGLTEGEIYHYWFEVSDSDPRRGAIGPRPRILCTDPAALVVDWRLLGPRVGPPYGEADRDPAGVVLAAPGGRLAEADPGGERPDWSADADP